MEALRAHRDYVARGRLSAGALRPPVFHAWERSHLLGADPLRLQADHLGERDAERLFERHRGLMEASRPYLAALSRAAGEEKHAAMLGDADGYLLDVVGDEESVHGPMRVPGPGALLSEAVAGANGIGSPLAEGGYIELVGPEHFIEGFHPFTCQGTPIRDPDAKVAATISTSVRRPETSRRVREILLCAAHGIEAELLRGRLEEDVRRVLASAGMDGELVEKLRQDVIQSQAAARLELETAARGLSRHRPEDALRLLQLAERSMDAFRRQSAIWHDLTSMEPGRRRRVALDQVVRDLAMLLSTEAAMGRIEIVLEELPALPVEADPRELLRRAFRCFVEAFDAARGGGAVHVGLGQARDGVAEVEIVSAPPPGSGREPKAMRVTAPLAREPGAGGGT